MCSFTQSLHLSCGLPLLFLSLYFRSIHFLHKFFTLHPLIMFTPSQSISFHPFHHSTISLHLYDFPYHTVCTRFHYSHHPTGSLHMRFSGNSFPQHTLLTAEPYSTSTSLIHTSRSERGCYSLESLFTSMGRFLPFRILTSDPMTLLLSQLSLLLLVPSLHVYIILFLNT